MCLAQGHNTVTLMRLEPAAQMHMLTYPVGLGLSGNFGQSAEFGQHLVCFIFKVL